MDHAWVYEWPEPEPDWEPLDEFRTVQQVELVEKLFAVTEHRARLYRSRTTGEAQNIAQRFCDYPASYFTFLKVPGVEPTNNSMEQRMQFVAIDRKITQGTRGERGRRWCERMWTVLATCLQRGRSAFQFLYQSIVAYFSGHAPPSLLAMPP